jgi:hypothetical protein
METSEALFAAILLAVADSRPLRLTPSSGGPIQHLLRSRFPYRNASVSYLAALTAGLPSVWNYASCRTDL